MSIVLFQDKGAPLTGAEADGNFIDLNDRLASLESGLAAEGIGAVEVVGDQMTILGTDGADYGTFTLPAPLTVKGAWATETAYAVRDVVRESGSAYVCVQDHVSETFADDLTAGYWVLIAEKGDTGDAATPVSWQGAWDNLTAYVQGDGVSHAGQLYVALTASTGSEPPHADWQPLVDALGDLSDVDLETVAPADGDLLSFDAGTGTWVPVAPAAGGGAGIVEVQSFTPGTLTGSQTLNQYVAAQACELIEASAGYAYAGVAPGSSEFPSVEIHRNGLSIAGVAWDELTNEGVLWVDDGGSTTAAIDAGDVITVFADGSYTASDLADISITLKLALT
jgi:hypothetical protein